MPECNICGGRSFSAAPNNRLSLSKKAPLCQKCGSLERQRIGRELTAAIRDRETFKSYSLLDVGQDSTVPKGWFASNKVTTPSESNVGVYGYGSEKYDFIVCSHVIQKLKDPRRGVQRLVQSLSDQGLMFLTYPSPATRNKTEEVGARRTNGPQYIFGRDFEKEYGSIASDAYVVAVDGVDPVTQDRDISYFVTRNPAWTTRIVKTLNARLVQ